MEEILRVFCVVLFFSCIGIIAIGCSKKVQQTHLKLLSKKNPYKGWVEGDVYISVVRFVGLFFLVVSISMIFFRLLFPWIPPTNK
jgi:TRAP-type C4-dicarboxylate transport system permease small subunit